MSLLTPAIQGSESLWFCMLMAFIIAFLQFLGVHGFNVVSGIILPLLIANTGANAAAYAAGELLQNIHFTNVPNVWSILLHNSSIILKCKVSD
mgnify:CR=1 FL=1